MEAAVRSLSPLLLLVFQQPLCLCPCVLLLWHDHPVLLLAPCLLHPLLRVHPILLGKGAGSRAEDLTPAGQHHEGGQKAGTQ